MYCQNCGTEIKGNFCDKCGAPAPQIQPQPQPQPQPQSDSYLYNAEPAPSYSSYAGENESFCAPPRKRSIFKQWWFWMILGIVVLAAAITLLISGLLKSRTTTVPVSQPAAQEPSSQMPAQETADGVVLCDQDGIRIVATGLNFDADGGFSVGVTIENATDTDYAVQVNSAAVNQSMAQAYFSCDVPAGTSVTDEIYFDYAELAMLGIDADAIGEIELSLVVFDWDTYEDLFVSDLMILQVGDGAYTRASVTGTTLYEAGGVRITYVSREVDSFGDGTVYLFIENDTDREISVQSLGFSIDDEMVDGVLYETVLPGYSAMASVYIWDQELSADELDAAELRMSFEIFDAQSYETIAQTDAIPFPS